jgi:hypothetical protein
MMPFRLRHYACCLLRRRWRRALPQRQRCSPDFADAERRRLAFDTRQRYYAHRLFLISLIFTVTAADSCFRFRIDARFSRFQFRHCLTLFLLRRADAFRFRHFTLIISSAAAMPPRAIISPPFFIFTPIFAAAAALIILPPLLSRPVFAFSLIYMPFHAFHISPMIFAIFAIASRHFLFSQIRMLSLSYYAMLFISITLSFSPALLSLPLYAV